MEKYLNYLFSRYTRLRTLCMCSGRRRASTMQPIVSIESRSDLLVAFSLLYFHESITHFSLWKKNALYTRIAWLRCMNAKLHKIKLIYITNLSREKRRFSSFVFLLGFFFCFIQFCDALLRIRLFCKLRFIFLLWKKEKKKKEITTLVIDALFSRDFFWLATY